ncbi:MAG: geranylgeranyl reductase family protein [Bacteroidetes bacterium]|nr:geranylgeranyl reductase family protein [Bacteroidota bacterium]
MQASPVIVGAGPAGTLCALLLARQGVPTLLLDKAVFPRAKTCGDALSGKALRALHTLDPALPQELAALPQTELYDSLLLSGPGGGRVHLQLPPNNDLGASAPGYLVSRYVFDNWLLELARNCPGITLCTHRQVHKAEFVPSQGIRLSFTSGDPILTPLAIGADGAHSVLAAGLTANALQRRHYAASVRAYYTQVAGLTSALELHFLKAIQPGYLWIFRMPGNVANVGVICRSDVVSRKKLNIRQLLQEALATDPLFSSRFAGAHLQSPVEGFGLPLASQRRQLTGPHFLLLGDAAGLVDPFTGEGIGNALLSATIAAETIASAYKTGDYSPKMLAGYAVRLRRRLHKELAVSRFLQKVSTWPGCLDAAVWALRHASPVASALNWAVRQKRRKGF